jgi:hypothetical protein
MPMKIERTKVTLVDFSITEYFKYIICRIHIDVELAKKRGLRNG